MTKNLSIRVIQVLCVSLLLLSCSKEAEEDNVPSNDKPAMDISWSEISPMPVSRGLSQAVVLNDKIYVIGGMIEGNELPTNTVDVYDPLSDTWERNIPRMKHPRIYHSANVVNGKIYVMGGCERCWGEIVTKSVEVYDPLTNEWTSIGNMPEAKGGFGTVVIDNKIYTFGGTLFRDDYVYNSVHVFDPSNNSWEKLSDMPYPREFMAAATHKGKAYLMGGISGPPWEALQTITAYDPVLDKWTENGTSMTPRYYAPGCCINNEMIFFVCGTSSCSMGGMCLVEAYSPGLDKSYKGTSMNYMRIVPSLCEYGNKLYVFGGASSSLPFPAYTDHSGNRNPQTQTEKKSSSITFTNRAEVGIPQFESTNNKSDRSNNDREKVEIPQL